MTFDNINDPRLVGLLRQGGVGILPTDTVYGLVCRAADEQAVTRLYGLKKREKKPGTVIAASVEQLVELGIKARYLKAVEHYWPNPISIVIPSATLEYIHLGLGSIAMRVSADDQLNKLLEKTGPLLSSSANHPGETEATTIEEAKQYFGNSVDFYVDDGDLSSRKPSTLIRIVDDIVDVLRKGAVNIDGAGRIIS